MTQAAGEAAGPGPFEFTPRAGAFVEGPAFSRTFRVVTTLWVLGLGFWLSLLWLGERTRGGSTSLLGWFFAAFAMIVFFWYWIMRSRTRIDSQSLHQSWYTDKHIAIAELASVGVLRVRGLEWLVAPRVHAKTLTGKFAIFNAADPALLAEFERLAYEVKAFRQR